MEASTAAAAKKPKGPTTYAVMVRAADSSWLVMGKEITATTRKDAIRQAVAKNNGETPSNQFMVMPARTITEHTRKTKTETVEEID